MDHRLLIAALLALAILGVVAFRLWAIVEAKVPWWLRLFVPNYRFFESSDAHTELEFRLVGDVDSGWENVIPARTIGVATFLWAPDATLRLLSYQLMDELLAEVSELGPVPLTDVQRLEKFERLVRLALFYHPDLGRAERGFQLRVVVRETGGESTVMLESEALSAPVLGKNGELACDV